jgi:tetratricopeptide (TPR) repeat protein
MSAHYNVYYNGNESFKEGVVAIQDANEDDYTQILPLFPDSKESSKEVATSQMDRAIEKGTKLIKKHSMRKKPKKRDADQSVKYQKFISQNEFNKWVDNAYLLIGKANFYKHEYYLAQQSFDFMFREYQPGPEWSEAEIWKARAAIEMGDLAKAKILLDNYDMHGKAPDRLYAFFAATYADYYLRQHMYREAVPFLQDAISGAWSKYYKLRFTFVLAQVYHSLHQYSDASNAYKRVINMSPPYQMAFNAKVNRASVMFGEGGLPAVQKEIARLLHDKRNQKYEDQIYYALAMAYKAEKQEKEAIENFLLSAEKSIENNYQKGLSFYELANIYYERPQYRPAYSFLDSALVNLDKSFSKLQEVTLLHDDLKGLVANINTVEQEDSLQRIAAMGEEERIAFINNLIQKDKEKQDAIQKQKEDLANNAFLSAGTTNSLQGGKWYFYNQKSVIKGKSEFVSRWGNRKLEDNWRRSNKEAIIEDMQPGLPDDIFGFSSNEDVPGDSISDSKQEQTAIPAEKSVANVDDYLKNLPLTEEALAKSNDKIQEALVSMGIIYKDEIENIPYAIDAFNQLLQRFPESKYVEDVLMNLYLCYEIQADDLKMAMVRKQLENQFPDGEFTAFLNDPDYFQKRAAKQQQIEDLYQGAYTSYLFNDFVTPIQNLSVVQGIDKESELLPKFKFLAGLSYAKSGNLTRFESELQQITQQYAKSEVAPVAKKLLEMYGKGRVPVKGPVNSNLATIRDEEFKKNQRKTGIISETETAPSSYTVDFKGMHSLVVLVNPEADLNRLKFNIADYNFSKFLLNDYEMSTTRLPDGTPVFVVSGFKNRLEGMDYFYALRERNEIFQVDNIEKFKLYVINSANMEFLLSSGDKKGYESFFVDNYLSAEAFQQVKEEKAAKKEEQVPVAELKENAPVTKEIVEKELVLDKKGTVVDREVRAKTVSPASKSEERLPEKAIASLEKEKQEEKEVIAEEAMNDTQAKELEPSTSTSAVAEETVEDIALDSKSDVFVKEAGPHSALILFKKGRINIQQTGNVFKIFSKNNYSANLEVTFGAKGTAFLYVKVDGFANAADAQAYLLKVKVDDYVMRDISRMQYYMWAISDRNYNLLSGEELYQQYQDFYKLNY